MQRSMVALVAVLALGLAACSTTGGQPDIVVNTGDTQTGISVSGVGEVTGTPDTVAVDLGVSVRGDTVAEATSSAATKADALIASLVANGVDREDITTTNYSIWPEYDWRNDTQVLLGYRVDNTVRAKIRNVSEAGDVLDDAIAAGGDDVRVNGLSFSIEDDADLIEAAREVAWNDALGKAQQLADLAGRTLGPATSINETLSRAPAPVPYETLARAPEGDFAATPIEPGSSSVMISIQVQFSLEG